MKRSKGLIYFLLSISIGYLFYNYLSTDYGYGMMSHHYGYYDNYSGIEYYLNTGLVVISYLLIIICTISLVNMKKDSTNYALVILDERLSKGDISIDEYKNIKEVINSK